MPSSLEQLFDRFRARRDPIALAEVYDRTASDLYRVALYLTGNPADAEELLQATYLAVIDAAPRYTRERPLMPWFVGILRRQAGLMRRRAARRPALDRLPERTPDDPAEAAARVEFDETIDRAIGDLPRTLQPVLVLRLKHGFAPGEIAHTLRRPPSTIRTQLSRGLERLRDILPPGLGGLAALGLLGRRGLAAVRRHVLATAAHAPVALAAVAGATAGKVLVACAVLAVALTATVPSLLRSDTPAPVESPLESSPPSVLAESTAARHEPTDNRVVREKSAGAAPVAAESSVVVVDEDGKPLVGVPVIVRSPAEREQVAFGHSGQDGTLSFELSRGVFELVANDARRARPAFGEARRLARWPLAAPVRLVLVERTGVLRVDVADDLMKPVEGVQVSIRRVRAEDAPDASRGVRFPARGEMPGCLREKDPGEPTDKVSCTACHAPPEELAGAAPLIQQNLLAVMLEQRRRQLEAAQREAELELRMRALVSGDPEVQDTLRAGLERSRSERSRLTGEQGTARFTGLAAGTFEVSLEGRPGLRVAIERGKSQRVALARAGRVVASFLLPRCGRVRLAVDQELSPSPARIRLRAAQSPYDVRQATIQVRDNDRRAVHLPPGTYEVECDVPPRVPVLATVPKTLQITSGRDTELPVRLAHVRGVLSGRVIDSNGDGVRGVAVLATAAGHPAKRTRTGTNGKFEIRGLPSTALTIALDPRRASGRGKSVYVIPGDTVVPRPTTGVLLTIERGFEMRVVVKDAKSGDKINGVPLRITPGPRGKSADGVARQGRAAFRPLRRGRYRIDVLGLDGRVFVTRDVNVGTVPASGHVETVFELPLADLKRR